MTRTIELRQRAIRSLKELLAEKEPRRVIVPALMGDLTGTCEVSGREAFSWVRPHGSSADRFEAYNGGRIRNVADVPVLVEVSTHPGRKPMATIIGRDYVNDPDWDEGTQPFYVARHAATHEARPGEGDDVVNVYNRAITELRADQQATPNMTVQVRAGVWFYGVTVKLFAGGNSPAMAAPAAGYRWDLVYLTSANVIAITAGVAAGVLAMAARPNATADTLPIAYILLNSTTTAITDDTIYDARQFVDQILSSSLANHPHSGGPHTGLVDGPEVDDYSTDVAQMQTTADPYPGGAPSLATTYEGELARLRYLLKQITGEANWYIDPDSDIAAMLALLNDHSARHEFGGGDAIDVGGLSGLLADEQDAGWIKGVPVDDGDIADARVLSYDVASGNIIYVDQSGGAGGGGFMPCWEHRGTLAVLVGAGTPVRMPYSGTIEAVLLLVEDQGSAGSTVVDINKNGATIFAAVPKPTVAWDDGDDYDVAIPDTANFAQYDEYTNDIDSVATDAANAWIIIICSLTGVADPYAPTTYPYAGFGASGDLSAEANLYEFYGRNLIKNSPGQIVTDGAEPQWWDDVANATITDEDLAGEAIAEKHKRAYKVVTIANDVYGYQTFTFADEDLLDAGETMVSLSTWVYCAQAAKASVGLYGTNLGLQESSQAGAGVWTLLKIEGITLDAADTSIDARFIVDTGTAYFTMPMLNVGPKALPWRPRGWKHVPLMQVAQATATSGDIAWSDTDCTATTHPLAAMIDVLAYAGEPNGSPASYLAVGHDDVFGADALVLLVRINVVGINSYCAGTVTCNDSQVIRYTVNEVDADNDVTWAIYITGYWRWE